MSAPVATKQRDVRLVLKEFASQFIRKAYPALMRSLVKDFRRESTRLLPSDMIQYIYLTAFLLFCNLINYQLTTLISDFKILE